MKKLLLLFLFLSVPAFADSTKYNDLGAFENQQNDFWDTTSHSRIDVGIAFYVDVETPAVGFNSRILKAYLSDTEIEIRRYHVDPPLVILLK